MGILLILGLIVGFLAGAGCIYWFMQQKLEEQKQSHLGQARKIREDLENIHEARMQETIQSLQADYQKQLDKTAKGLEAAHEFRMRETIKTMEARFEVQLQQANQLLESERKVASNLSESVDIVEVEEKNSISSLEDPSELPVDYTVEELVALVEEAAIPVRSMQEIPETPVVNAGKTTPVEEEVQVPINQAYQEEIIVNNPIINALEVNNSSPVKSSKSFSEKSRELAQQIEIWGNSREGRYISQLTNLVYHSDTNVRQQAASALGKIVSSKNIRSEIQQAVPVLGKLSKDSDASVRQSAVEALGTIKSETVIPLLQQALRDSDRDVVKSASAALSQLKFYRVGYSVKPSKTASKPTRR